MAARNRRHSSVLPVPTSPVILMKPSPFFTATSSVLSASWWVLQAYAKWVSGVIPKGISRRPKWARYMLMTERQSLLRRLWGQLRPAIHPLDALARLGQILLPVAVAVDDGRFQQDDDLALGADDAALPEQGAQAGSVADAGQPRALVDGFLFHQAADRHDIAVLHAHDGVGLVDGAGGERQRERAEGAQVHILAALDHRAHLRMDVQDDVVVLVDLGRD